MLKIVERLAVKQFSAQTGLFNWLPVWQSAYRKFYSTETAVTVIHNDSVWVIDSKQLSVLALDCWIDRIKHSIWYCRPQHLVKFLPTSLSPFLPSSLPFYFFLASFPPSFLSSLPPSIPPSLPPFRPSFLSFLPLHLGWKYHMRKHSVWDGSSSAGSSWGNAWCGITTVQKNTVHRRG